MKDWVSIIVCLGSTLSVACSAGVQGLKTSPLRYPETRKGPIVEQLHGVEIADPYRWLEQGSQPEVHRWIEAENKVTFGFLGNIPERDRIAKRLTSLWNYARTSPPTRRGERLFFSVNDGLQNQDVFCVSDRLGGKARVLIDPNTLSSDGTTSVKHYEVSPDGRLVAYALSDGGSDWVQYKVRNVATGEDLKDHLRWVKFSRASWLQDSSGFYYTRYPAPSKQGALQDVNAFPKVHFHRLGDAQSADALVYERADKPRWGFGAQVTDDGRHLVLGVWNGTSRKNGVFVAPLGGDAEAKGPPDFVELLADFDAKYRFLGSQDDAFFFHTDLNAPLGAIIAIDLASPEREHWRVVVKESSDAIQDVRWVGGHFVVEYLRDARSLVKVFDRQGAQRHELKLPSLGSVTSLRGGARDGDFFFKFSSYVQAPTVFRTVLESGEMTPIGRAKVAGGLGDYVVKQVFYASKDGTKIPMFIAHKRGLVRDGTHPTYLYGYGGFNIAITPNYSTKARVWMEMGGIFAVANIRGGGEYGRDWHLAGSLNTKQNVFDDFIAAGEFLVSERYTVPAKLAISGRSNGGLLVGACMTQRPDLFGAALPAVGVLDMLRFHKFTIGWAWVSDYGSPDKKEEFEVLRRYSPLHNLVPGTSYPATMVMTADHDDRVVPAHSFKFAAALQAAHVGPNPVLIRIDTKSGHGAGRSTHKRIAEAADVFAFLLKTLNMRLPAEFK